MCGILISSTSLYGMYCSTFINNESGSNRKISVNSDLSSQDYTSFGLFFKLFSHVISFILQLQLGILSEKKRISAKNITTIVLRLHVEHDYAMMATSAQEKGFLQ
jgi:hypothetical protein